MHNCMDSPALSKKMREMYDSCLCRLRVFLDELIVLLCHYTALTCKETILMCSVRKFSMAQHWHVKKHNQALLSH